MGKILTLLASVVLVFAAPAYAQQSPAEASPKAEKASEEQAKDKARREARKQRREHRKAINHRHLRKH